MATKSKSAATPAMSKLDVLFDASVNAAKSDDALKAAFIAAGGDQDEPKKVLMSGRISHSLKVTREEALRVMNRTGRGKKPDNKDVDAHDLGDDVRTTREEKACGAARVFLSGRLKSWGLKTSENRGGDRTKDDDAMSTDKLKMAPKPKVTDDIELGAYCLAFAQQGYSFFLLNKEHPAVKSDIGAELMGAFADLLDSVKETVASYKG